MTKADTSGERPDAATRIKAALIILAAFTLLIALYSPARNMGFYFDDRITILQNEKIHADSAFTAMGENPFRGLVNLSFWLQLQIHRPTLPPGDHDLARAAPKISRQWDPVYQRDLAYYTDQAGGRSFPVSIDPDRGLVFAMPPALPFRALNLIIHALNALILFRILRRLGPGRDTANAAAALAFLIAPLATEAVNYITARFGLMAATFSLAAVLAHLQADQKPIRDLAAAALFLCALICKETAAALPLIVFLLDLARGKKSLRPLLGLALSGLYILLRLRWQIELGPQGSVILPWYQYLIVQQRILWLYLALAVLPIHLNFEHHITPKLIADVTIALFNLAALAASAVILFKTWKRPPEPAPAKKPQKSAPAPTAPPGPWPAAVVLMLWLVMAPTSSLLPLSDLVREERAYPIILILIPALVSALSAVRLPGPRAARRALAVCILACFAGLTASRNAVWRSELSLARDAAAKSPGDPRAVYNYGVALKWSRHYREAINWFERAARLDPGRAQAVTEIDNLRREIEKQKREEENP